MNVTFRGITHAPHNSVGHATVMIETRDHLLAIPLYQQESELLLLTGRDLAQFTKQELNIEASDELLEARFDKLDTLAKANGGKLDPTLKSNLEQQAIQFHEDAANAFEKSGLSPEAITAKAFDYYRNRRDNHNGLDADNQPIIEIPKSFVFSIIG